MQTRTRLIGRMRHGYLLAFVWLACAWLPLYAATTQPAPAASVDPPSQVARISWLAGTVSLLPAGASQWQDVDLNLPLTSGDELATSADARVELQLGAALAHLAGNTDFTLLTLGEWQTQLALTQGTAELDVGTLPDGEYVEIDTPQVAVVIDRSARVRVDLGTGAASTVTVRRGTVVVHGDDGAQQVLQAGERYRFASPDLGDAVALTFGSGDAFDRWAQSREMMLYADSGSSQYVAPGTVGYQDLDYYGEWQSEPEYGAVWFPNDVATGWVPYRNGRWVSIAPWGMTWVSNEPWGFAPFHYGRWAMIRGRWGWLPGRIGVRAVYAPALVGFFGGNGWNVSVSVGVGVGVGGLVGWYPLGPGMIYNPWYHADWRYYARINRCDIRARRGHHDQRIRNAYNAWRKPRLARHMSFLGQAPHGITVVSRKNLERGHDMQAVHLKVADRHVLKAPLRYRGLNVAPRRLRSATWHPRPVAGAGKPVVAVHSPRPVSVATLQRGQKALHARRAASVRLLTGSARRMGPVHRPLSPRTLAHLSSHRARPTAAHPAVRTQTPDPHATRAAPIRRAARATLPRVPQLELGTQARAVNGTATPDIARMRELQAVRAATRHADAFTPATPSVTRVPPAPRRAGTPSASFASPRPAPVQRSISVQRYHNPLTRPALPQVTRLRAARPAPAYRAEGMTPFTPRAPRPAPRATRPSAAPAWHAAAPRPAPVRRADPVRFRPAPVSRARQATSSRAVRPPAVHRAPSRTHASKGRSNARTSHVRPRTH